MARRGALLIEDAFHTASLPGAEDGRLWIIRRLALGRINSRFSAAKVALTLEQRMRWLDSSVVHAEDSSAHNANAVYFCDAVEPYVCLARRLIRHAPTEEWFWPLAVPGCKQAQSRSEAWRGLIFGLLRQPAGVVAMPALLRELRESAIAETLSSALRPQDGEALLQICGWTRPITALPGTERLGGETTQLNLPGHWQRTLEWCCEDWGACDARTLWLAALVLVADKATRLADGRLIERAEKLLARIAIQTEERFQAEKEGLAVGKASTSLNQGGDGECDGLVRLVHSADISQSARVRTETGRTEPALNLEVSRTDASANPQHTDDAQPLARLPEASSFSETPMATRHAGLFLLLRVLERLGIQEFLNKHPGLIELEFPQRLLCHAARRLGVPSDDPACEALTLTAAYGLVWPEEFVMPLFWSNGLSQSGPWQVRRIDGQRGVRLLCDASGRLVMAGWRNEAPVEVSAFVKRLSLRRTRPRVCQVGETIVLDSWLTAMRRWCRRFAGIGLHNVVCRPRRMLMTRTHLNIFFDHRQADVRIRKAGLDLDPGWLPWLGRVVNFHYV
jgi:hypothetical protein